MDMRIDSRRIRAERNQRAWSQEHLAHVTDLGLRTVQRVETSGVASNESATAIAAAFGVPVADLLVQVPDAARHRLLTAFMAKRLWLLVAIAVVAEVVSPPQLTAALVALWAWVAVELLLAVVRRRSGFSGA
jgi:transcriptional regulator with XRE-family HTH domain